MPHKKHDTGAVDVQGIHVDDDAPTRKIDVNESGVKTLTADGERPATGVWLSAHHSIESDHDEAETVVYRPGKPGVTMTRAGADVTDPPVGFLVIIDGPGKGHTLAVRTGANAMGRDHGERICIDFGDPHISRHGHAVVTYDPRSRRYYVHAGDGHNLVYLDDQPVLTPASLTSGAHLRLGETLMRFVPLCDADFDWADVAQG